MTPPFILFSSHSGISFSLCGHSTFTHLLLYAFLGILQFSLLLYIKTYFYLCIIDYDIGFFDITLTGKGTQVYTFHWDIQMQLTVFCPFCIQRSLTILFLTFIIHTQIPSLYYRCYPQIILVLFCPLTFSTFCFLFFFFFGGCRFQLATASSAVWREVW